MTITKQQILQWLENCNQQMLLQRDYLTELDTAIGDADHGLNMARGFSKVQEKIASVADKDIGQILKTVGMTLLSQVGGASGPLYGSFFLKGAELAKDKDALSIDELIAVFKTGINAVVARGRAELGDKTLCDFWLPLIDYLEKADKNQPVAQFFAEAVAKAEQFVTQTTAMQAKKGRASYLGERSIGHQDPGASSSYYLFLALADAVK